MTAHLSLSQTEIAIPVTVQTSARRAVITGVGIIGSAGEDAQAFRLAAEEGRQVFRAIDRFDTSWCETKIAAQMPVGEDAPFVASRRTGWMDRAAWYALKAAELLLADAKLDLSRFNPERIAIVLGTCHSGFVTQERLFERRFAGDSDGATALEYLPILSSHVAAVLATRLGAKGPRRVVSTACASSTGAIGLASDLIRRGEADLVITGGVDTLSLSIFAGFSSLGALAPEGCTPFSGSPGITLGEGAALFTLERLDVAQDREARIHAEVVGYALNGDAYHATAPDENGDGIERVMRMALDHAGLGVADIDYVSAHGTGTQANDRAETAATARLFGADTPASSPKSILGHNIGACGAFEIALTLAMAERGRLVPTLRFEQTREGCQTLDFVPQAAREGATETLLCNNYGFGGANASVVLRRTAAPALAPPPAPRARVVISGVGVLTPRGDQLFGAAPTGDDPRRIGDPGLPPALKRTFGRMSPMIKYGIMAARRAMTAAGLDGARAEDVGLVMGAITGAQRANEKYMESVFVDGPAQASAQHFAYSTNNAATGQISIACDLKGYNCTMVGGVGAMGYAISLIEDRRQTQVAVVATDELTEILDEVYARTGVVTKGEGAVCEGAAAFVLEQETAARARGGAPIAEILGFGEAQDATFTGVKRNGDALSRAIAAALAQAGLAPGAILRAYSCGAPSPRFAAAQAAALRRTFGLRQPEVVALDRAASVGPAFAPLAAVIAAAQGEAATPTLAFGVDLSGVSFAAVVQAIPGERHAG